MATEKLTMRKIRDVLRLHYEQNLSNRKIGRSLKVSPGTVSNYLVRAKTANIDWPLSDEWTEDKLYASLFPAASGDEISRALPDWAKTHQELKRKGVTLMSLWHEYQSCHPNGIGYSRFCELYREFSGKLNPVMRLNHRAGEKLFVDYSGLTMNWVDKETGLINQASVHDKNLTKL